MNIKNHRTKAGLLKVGSTVTFVLLLKLAFIVKVHHILINNGKASASKHKGDVLQRQSVDNNLPSNSTAYDSKGSTTEITTSLQRRLSHCLPWHVNGDDWWSRHPGWKAGAENDTHYCFEPFSTSRVSNLYKKLYKNQQHNNCSRVITKKMWQSGWGADLVHIADALLYGLAHGRPIQVSGEPWHYAASKDGSRPVCPSKDMYCYFLPLTKCEANPQDVFRRSNGSDFLSGNHPNLVDRRIQEVISYVTRPRTWLRKAVYEFSKTIPLTSPCSVIHVRRADVVLHGTQARRYHAMNEYMKAGGQNLTRTIFLLTDDANAIEEATTQYPEYNWVYINRPRSKGSEGGWENQIPSNDPKLEVVVLLTIFRLIPMCQTFVYSESNMGRYMAGIMMKYARNRCGLNLLNLDEKKAFGEVFSIRHAIDPVVL